MPAQENAARRTKIAVESFLIHTQIARVMQYPADQTDLQTFLPVAGRIREVEGFGSVRRELGGLVLSG